jgi:hypothetical protein
MANWRDRVVVLAVAVAVVDARNKHEGTKRRHGEKGRRKGEAVSISAGIDETTATAHSTSNTRDYTREINRRREEERTYMQGSLDGWIFDVHGGSRHGRVGAAAERQGEEQQQEQQAEEGRG